MFIFVVLLYHNQSGFKPVFLKIIFIRMCPIRKWGSRSDNIMSGHRKGAQDAKRGAIFTKLAKIVTIAAREKGGDLDTNFNLRMAVERAKQANMPKDNIERAIKKGTGEIESEQIEELIYEGIGPENSQFIVKCLTDNRNRSAASVRHLFTKAGGSLGAVMWNFEQKGVIRIEKAVMGSMDMDEFELEMIDLGADDIEVGDEEIVIYTGLDNLQSINKVLEDKHIKIESAEMEYTAKEKQDLDDEAGERLANFMEALGDCEDVADYYTNVR